MLFEEPFTLTCFLRSVIVFCISPTNSLKSFIMGAFLCLSKDEVVLLKNVFPLVKLEQEEKQVTYCAEEA